ncbi:DUF1566 domain-containing protein [Pseudomonas hefeiensis]|uniref:DUF1566 domain-containing protein n=1 Tax=Pseudomonas hefeiensis TaxID=2738125 RepID=A0ABY9G3Z7_9PSED|nr:MULTISPECIES: DUF1566 domain-containing protein [unclassified Pseudomonas]WLH10355.1 DUF1566 domain-containing protein [Pseudomonas sp. FP205]WLH93432.1 DUF1566 domain-containing protein [Pseudomonas sp. FP53]WLI37721.1 DUF1566 domain-containing protein [Pseudomonas sp. FP821]
MKPEMITLKHGDATIKMPASSLAKIAMASTFAVVFPQAANVAPAAPTTIPALGEYWPGQGGVNAGFVSACGDVPAHYLIIGDKDLGEFKWGRYREESEATSRWDGKLNTDALIAAGDHPAAKEARAYTADGHVDFDLPAAAQLYQVWVHGLIAEGAYWSSSQRSANYAFYMYFVDGNQYSTVKSYELRVRPVRRFFI